MLNVNFLHAHILYKKSESAIRWKYMFCLEMWKNFVDQANISKVMPHFVELEQWERLPQAEMILDYITSFVALRNYHYCHLILPHTPVLTC